MIILKLFAATALLAALSATPARADWYVTNVGDALCVPVKNISADFRYISDVGPFKTPQDVMRAMGLPARLATEPSSQDHLAGYSVIAPMGKPYMVLFVTDQDFCKMAARTTMGRDK